MFHRHTNKRNLHRRTRNNIPETFFDCGSQVSSATMRPVFRAETHETVSELTPRPTVVRSYSFIRLAFPFSVPLSTMATAPPAAKRAKISRGEGGFLFIEGSADGLVVALADARKDGLLCDAELQCGDGNGSGSHSARLSAHRNVLAARSDYMKALLASDRFADSTDRVIRLPDVSNSVMTKLLQWMYGEPFWLDSLEEAMDFTEAASRLQCVDLLSLLAEMLAAEATVENFFALWDLAVRLDLPAVADAAERVAAMGYHVIAGRDDFLTLSPDRLRKLVSSDKLAVNEEDDVFLSIIRWANSQDEQVVAANLEDLVSRVRFQFVSKDFFSLKVEKEPLLEKYPTCFRAIAKAQAGCMNGNNGRTKRHGIRLTWDAVKDGMMVKVIDDVDELERVCMKERLGWNGIKHRIAGKRLKVLRKEACMNAIYLDQGNWSLPLEAIDFSDGTEERYLSADSNIADYEVM